MPDGFLGDVMHQGSREELIMDAAEAVLARFGERRMTMDDVAEAIGLSRPAIYQYFKSKNELVLATLTRLHEQNLNRIEDLIARKPSHYAGIDIALKERASFLMGLMSKSSHKSWFETSSVREITEKLDEIEARFTHLIGGQLQRLGYTEDDADLAERLLVLFAHDMRHKAKSEKELFERLDFCVYRLIRQRARVIDTSSDED